MDIQPHAFAPSPGSTRCAVPGCRSPRLAMIHAVRPEEAIAGCVECGEPLSPGQAAFCNRCQDAIPSGSPFPAEPAFGSPEAVGQAADAVFPGRGIAPGLVAVLEDAGVIERDLTPRPDAEDLEVSFGLLPEAAQERVDRLVGEREEARAEVERLRAEVERLSGEPPATWVRCERLDAAIEQREALADALEPILDLIALSPTFGNKPEVVLAVAAGDAALREADRL